MSSLSNPANALNPFVIMVGQDAAGLRDALPCRKRQRFPRSLQRAPRSGRSVSAPEQSPLRYSETLVSTRTAALRLRTSLPAVTQSLPGLIQSLRADPHLNGHWPGTQRHEPNYGVTVRPRTPLLS